MKKQFFSLALFAAAWLASGSAQAWDKPAQVDGVYQIGTASELEWFAEYVNSAEEGNTAMLLSKAVLTANIDMTGISHTPIGASTTYKYDGEFDGQHHVISNMIIDLPNQENVALFGLVRGNAVIKNIIIDSSCSIKGKNRVAGIIGCVQTKADLKLSILNCVNMAPIHAYSGVASGIIGAGQSKYPVFKMHNCVNTGAITTNATNNYTVAFDGWNKYDDSGTATNSQVWCCYNNGTLNRIDGGNNIFRGSNRSVLNTYDLKYTTSTYQTQSNIPDDVKTANGGFKTADPLHSGELCYYLNHGIQLMSRSEVTLGEEFTQDLSDPNSIPMPNASGMKVYQVAALDCAGNPKSAVTYSNNDDGSRDPHNFVNGICSVCGATDDTYVTLNADGYYHLSNAYEVEWFSAKVKEVKNAQIKAKLDADIDFTGKTHTPIGPNSGAKFFGEFDGQGHTISNLTMNESDNAGFFLWVRGGSTIKNLIMDSSCSFHATNRASAFVCVVQAAAGGAINIENCINKASVSSDNLVSSAFVAACNWDNTDQPDINITNCWNAGNITHNGTDCAAALFGWNKGTCTIKGCFNTGTVSPLDNDKRNLVRSESGKTASIIYTYDLSATPEKAQGVKTDWTTETPISSGELCYFLNGDQSTIGWKQTIGTDPTPLLFGSSKQVYAQGSVNCLGIPVGDVTYGNTNGTIDLGHNINNEIGMCDVCYTQFQEPASDGDYYLLANAGNVEWLSEQVKNGGGAAFYAKLTNDIDFLNRENLHSPIGPTTGSKFKGVFDGQGFRIKNMIINRPTVEAQGFFGWLQGNDNTTIRNLIIAESCSIIGSNKCGGIAGASQNSSETAKITIENVVNEANVTVSGQDVAGIVGGESGNKATYYIHNVVNKGDITSTHQDPFAGALFCYQEKGTVENFLNLGTITGHKGGNIGRFAGTKTNIIDLSDTNPEGSTNGENLGFDSGLIKADLATGKVAYTLGFKQLIGSSEYPSPLNEDEVKYVGNAGYTTMYDATNDWELNGDAQAYIGTLNGSSSLHLTEIDDIPAGTAVVISGTYYNKLAATTTTANTTANVLLGSDGTKTGGDGIYALAIKNEKVGFYPVAASVTIPEGKAYLEYTSTGSNPVKGFTFVFDEDDATGISLMEDGRSQMEGGAIYNIAGQRISKMQKGINIVNGKKVLK